MDTYEFTERAGDDCLVRLNIPVETAGKPYRLVVHVAPVSTSEKAEYLTEDFINETAGKWVGDFIVESHRDYEERESL